jgi:hypothetical protein
VLRFLPARQFIAEQGEGAEPSTPARADSSYESFDLQPQN